jgi:HEAT repeat protein
MWIGHNSSGSAQAARPFSPRCGGHQATSRTAALIAWLVMLCAGSCKAKEPLPAIPADVSPKITRLIELTLSANSEECAAAARELGQLQADAAPAVPFLVRLLSVPGSAAANVRDAAYEALRTVGEPAVQPLLDQVKRPSADRGAIVGLLSQIGDGRATEQMIKLLDDSDAEVRELAIAGLEQMPDARALRPLLKLLRADSNAAIRAKAASALGQLDDRSAVEPLIQALQHDTDPDVRYEAALSLGLLHDMRASDALLAVLHKDGDLEVRGKAALALAWLGDTRSIDQIVAFARGAHESYGSPACDAVGALGFFRDPRAIACLTRILLDNSEGGRISHSALVAASALGRLKDSRAIEPLVSVWQDSTRATEVRVAAALSLTATKDHRVLDALAYVMKNGARNDKERALECVGGLRDPRAAELAKSALTDKDRLVRIAVSIALKRHELAVERDKLQREM